MIRLVNICKSYRVGRKKRIILDHLDVDFEPGVHTGILGRNGSGKSTLVNIIGGAAFPDAGRVERTSSISWPIGFTGCINSKLSGRANLNFICRLYGVDVNEIIEFVREFSEVGEYLDMPVKKYSPGMAAKLAYSLCMALGFDFYLVDEVTTVGDAAFRAKCKTILEQRKKSASMIVVSHNVATIRKHCQHVGVLDNGTIVFHNDVESAIAHYEEISANPMEIRFA